MRIIEDVNRESDGHTGGEVVRLSKTKFLD